MSECCRECKHFKKLYVPPVRSFDEVHKNGFVCTMLENEVMFLGYGSMAGDGMCECFSEKQEGT